MNKFILTVVAALTAWTTQSQAQTIFNLTYAHPLDAGQATVLLDFNNDGLLDFVTANKTRIGFAKNLGNGLFQNFDTATVDNANGFGSYDLNGDGILDFSVAQEQDNFDDNWICNGNSTFTVVNSGNESVGSTRSVIYADFDNDGFVDSYHSASAFSMNRQGNQIHKGLPNGQFGPDVAETIMPGYFYASLVHPTLGAQYWSNRQWKGAIARDLDRDGFVDIVNVAYLDLGFQPDTFTTIWVSQQSRGAYILKNTSTVGNLNFSDVSFTALGTNANGADSSFWSVYSPIPLDYDNDGDYDLVMGGLVVKSIYTGQEINTDIVRFYENVSTPGNIQFVNKTSQVGLQFVNNLPIAAKRRLSLAAGIPIDYDNDGFTDFAFVNRKDGTTVNHVLLFKNNGNGTFSQIQFANHGIGGVSGGRDINVGDLNNDGKLDIILSDGTVGGFTGTDSTLVFMNNSTNSNKWVQLNIKTSPGGTWAFDHTVKIFKHGTTQLLGMDDIRTDVSYRSKRYPILHFGLGSTDSVDVQVIKGNNTYNFNGLPANVLHQLYLSNVTGIDDISIMETIILYPNPVNTFLNIQNPENKTYDYTIHNLLGQTIQLGKTQQQINVSQLSQGVYIIQLKTGNGKLITQKFIKE